MEALDSLEIAIDDANLAEPELIALSWMESISWICDRLSRASDGVRDGLDSVAGILQSEAHTLNPRGRGSSNDGVGLAVPSDYNRVETVRQWAQQELEVLLNSHALRETLFDEASEVTLDLESAVVSWTAPGTAYQNSRPLEAFSSGEQVFAYTRARLEELRSRESWQGHRLVILDEFGAFVARNRFAQLLEFVYQQALGELADQIVVMLPLSSDYANEAFAQELVRGASNASRKSELLDRVRQVEQNGYFAIPVDVTTNAASK